MAKKTKYSNEFVRTYSNEKLLSLQRSINSRPSVFRGSGIPQVVKSEISTRKKNRKMNKSAGKKRLSSNPFGIPRGFL